MQGTIIAAFGRSCVVEYVARDGSNQVIRCHLRGRQLKPVCGDRILWRRADAEDGVVEQIETRSNHFPRVLPNGKVKIVAANLDLILITVAQQPPPTRDLINRYLVASRSVEIEPLIVLNKTDLLDEESRELWFQRSTLYRELGYGFVEVCAKQPVTVESLRELLIGKRGILVGQSGVASRPSPICWYLMPIWQLPRCPPRPEKALTPQHRPLCITFRTAAN